jgi:hypothetical protein
MNARHAAFAFLLALAPICRAETSPPAIDLEARKASVANLEIHVAQREARLAELGKDIITLDARIEKRVDELVKLLAELRDSPDSRFRVSQLKQEAITSLRNGIELYARKRAEMLEKVRTGDATALPDLGKFDERNMTRVEQIVELTKSFPAEQDVKKYESNGSSYWNGYYYESVRVTDDWKQARRDNHTTEQQRDDIQAALREGIERLDQRRRALTELLANPALSESARTLHAEELGQIDANTERLNTQLKDLTTSARSGEGAHQASLDEAVDIGEMFEDARKDLRGDVANLFRLYDEFARERKKTADLKQNLVARKAWLEKNHP